MNKNLDIYVIVIMNMMFAIVACGCSLSLCL